MMTTSDFSAATVQALARLGVRVMAPVAIADLTSPMPWANPIRGYSVDDNGTHRVMTFSQILVLAGAPATRLRRPRRRKIVV